MEVFFCTIKQPFIKVYTKYLRGCSKEDVLLHLDFILLILEYELGQIFRVKFDYIKNHKRNNA